MAILARNSLVDPTWVSEGSSSLGIIRVQRYERMKMLDVMGKGAVRERLECGFRLPLEVLSQIVWHEEVGSNSLVAGQILTARTDG